MSDLREIIKDALYEKFKEKVCFPRNICRSNAITAVCVDPTCSFKFTLRANAKNKREADEYIGMQTKWYSDSAQNVKKL